MVELGFTVDETNGYGLSSCKLHQKWFNIWDTSKTNSVGLCITGIAEPTHKMGWLKKENQVDTRGDGLFYLSGNICD